MGRDCGNKGLAILYFVTFGIFGTMVFTNLFIAVILDVYKDNVDMERDLFRLFPIHDWKDVFVRKEIEWRKEKGLGDRQGFMPVKYFLGTLTEVPQLVGLMLDACNLRLQLNADSFRSATVEDLALYKCKDHDELD